MTDGVISTFVPDPLGHVHDNRFELETTARVAHGNSGGAAIDDHGDLIGVPSLTIPGEGGDISWRLRSVAEAAPLVEDARTGRPYVSHLARGAQRQGESHWNWYRRDGDAACTGAGSAASGLAQLSFGFAVTDVPAGLDYALLIDQPDGTLVHDVHGAIPQAVFQPGRQRLLRDHRSRWAGQRPDLAGRDLSGAAAHRAEPRPPGAAGIADRGRRERAHHQRGGTS